MKQVTYSEARQDLSNLINLAYNDSVPVYITRKNGMRVVMINADDYDALEETEYLCRSEANLKRIKKAIADMDAKANVREVSEVQDLFK